MGCASSSETVDHDHSLAAQSGPSATCRSRRRASNSVRRGLANNETSPAAVVASDSRSAPMSPQQPQRQRRHRVPTTTSGGPDAPLEEDNTAQGRRTLAQLRAVGIALDGPPPSAAAPDLARGAMSLDASAAELSHQHHHQQPVDEASHHPHTRHHHQPTPVSGADAATRDPDTSDTRASAATVAPRRARHHPAGRTSSLASSSSNVGNTTGNVAFAAAAVAQRPSQLSFDSPNTDRDLLTSSSVHDTSTSMQRYPATTAMTPSRRAVASATATPADDDDGGDGAALSDEPARAASLFEMSLGNDGFTTSEASLSINPLGDQEMRAGSNALPGFGGLFRFQPVSQLQQPAQQQQQPGSLSVSSNGGRRDVAAARVRASNPPRQDSPRAPSSSREAPRNGSSGGVSFSLPDATVTMISGRRGLVSRAASSSRQGSTMSGVWLDVSTAPSDSILPSSAPPPRRQ